MNHNHFKLYHNELSNALHDYRGGAPLPTWQIKEITRTMYPNISIGWAQPSDHCKNHDCEKCCPCARTNNAIFKKIKRGLYKVI